MQIVAYMIATVVDGTLDFEILQELPDKEIMKRLTKLRGIESWTAKMYLMFVLNCPNIIPFEDGTFL